MLVRASILMFFFACLAASAGAQDRLNAEWLRNDLELQEGKITDAEWLLRQQQVLQHLHDHPESGVVKCVTPLYVKAQKLGLPVSTPEQESELKRRKLVASNFLSESGLFRIYYETTGSDAVPPGDENNNGTPDYVEWVAEAADSSYRHEILTLGFPDPIPAGSEYSVFVSDFGFYGLTRVVSGEPAQTVIEIENDFVGFPENTDPEGDQIGAVKVTMAHEFKHAIQYVQNRWRGDTDLWAEMDATLYEEVVYDDVNDYYNYLDGFASNLFIAPQVSIIPGSYEDITWALYFHDRFGDSFWTEVWEVIEQDPVRTRLFDAMRTTFEQYPKTFEEAVIEAASWHFASGPVLHSANFGFDESPLHPAPRIRERFNSLSDELSEEFNVSRFAANYFEYDLLQPVSGFVQFNFESSSTDLQFALLGYEYDGGVRYLDFDVLTEETEEEQRTSWKWSDLERVGVVVFNASPTNSATYRLRLNDHFPEVAEGIQLSQNYPNPFNPQTIISISMPGTERVRLEVFDPAGRLIRVLHDGTLPAGINEIVFNAQDLASGVYVYSITTSAGVQARKMLLLK